MVKKLNSMPDYRARMPKQPHDLSRSFAFTSCPGMELPFFTHMCHPHDELFFGTGCFTRLNPIALPALAQVDFHLDYFFVPLTVMYTPSNVLHYGTDDLISVLFVGTEPSDGLRDKFPVLNLNAQFSSWNNFAINDSDGEFSGFFPWPSIPAPRGSLSNPFLCMGQSAYRLLDQLGYNPNGIFLNASSTPPEELNSTNPSITPWFLAAYQACHQLYFRNDDRERKSYIYNFDDKFNVSSWFEDGEEFFNGGVSSLLAIRYRSRYKDYFNAVKVSPLSSGVSLRNFFTEGQSTPVNPSTYLRSVHQFLNSPRPFVTNDTSSSLVSLGSQSTQVSVGNTGSNTPLSTGAIRSMFALEKLIRVVGRANKDYESQVLAHFGVRVPHDVMHNITHIAHDMFSLRPEPVVSTAETAEGSLGELGGQGQVSFSGNRHKFTAPCHGVFIAIISSIPRMRYEAGFDKSLVFNDRLDFWQPEFDRLGMQPLFTYEVLPRLFDSSQGRVGWQFGYEHLKRKYDRISQAFHESDSNSFSPWVLSQRPYIGLVGNGTTGDVISAMSDLYYSNFLVTPMDINKIMLAKFNPGWSDDFIASPWSMYYRDAFIHDVGFDCKVVNFMSEYGEPELD